MADSIVPNEIRNKPCKYVQTYCVTNLSGILRVFNLCYLAKLNSRDTLYGNARGLKTLAEREVRLATILGILNTPVNESDHIRD